MRNRWTPLLLIFTVLLIRRVLLLEDALERARGRLATQATPTPAPEPTLENLFEDIARRPSGTTVLLRRTCPTVFEDSEDDALLDERVLDEP
jgi:hypothetical protein